MSIVEAGKASMPSNPQNENIRTCGGFTMEIFRGEQTYGRRLDELRERVARIYIRGFGLGIMQTAEEVRQSIIGEGSIFIVSKEVQDVAFSAQRLMRIPIPIDDKGSVRLARVAFTNTRLVLPEYQDKGIGKWTMNVCEEEYKPDYFAGRTQNPAIHLGWKSLPFTGEDRPIDKDFRGEDLKSRQYRAVLWAVARTSKKPVDVYTGLAEGVYKEGETRGYSPDLTNERYVEIDKRMEALGLVRADGDTLYYIIERVEPPQNNLEQVAAS